MNILLGISLLLLGCNRHVEGSLSTSFIEVPVSRGLVESVPSTNDFCYEWFVGGDAETGEPSDWEIGGTGVLELSTDAPVGSSRSFKISSRDSVNAGPGQDISTDCLQIGKQYKLTASMKITNENGEDTTCDKYAEWLDPDFCPIFTIMAQLPSGEARFNLGNDMISFVEWVPGEWNPYQAIFTVDEYLSQSLDAHIYIRGPPPGVVMYFDDVSLQEYVGEDTRYNFWTSAPNPEGTNETECISRTFAESMYATTDILTVSNYTNQYYNESETYSSSSQCAVINGDAESGYIDGWVPMGSQGGFIFMHNVGPESSTKAFKHVDRPSSNSGPGQDDIDVECFALDQAYELKAKIKLVDENGFPFYCERNATLSSCDSSCPIFTFVILSDGQELNQPVPNDITGPWIAEEFNEYHSIFEVSQTFLNSISAGFLFKGPKVGVNILFDDVSMTPYEGPLSVTPVPSTDLLDGPCTSLIISSSPETGSLSDWEIKDHISGELVIYPDGPGDQTQSFQHKGRAHVNSGPGQDLNATCLTEGKQYILTAEIKIEDEIFGNYACDKYGVWLDPDFCPLFTIWVDEGEGDIARFNIGNDYYHHFVWHEIDYNPYYAIFTVDERLAAADTAYLYLRGPRRNATMMFTDVSIQEYVGTDTRYNFWTSVSPESDGEFAFDMFNGVNPTFPPLPFTYEYYSSSYVTGEASSEFCEQLVTNGDAEAGDMDGWEIFGPPGGAIVEHHEGPVNLTQSFKHIDRSAFSSGPGQILDLPCLQLNALYEVKAKIKLFDVNGFPFRCAGNFQGDDLSCPIFTIVVKQPTGDWKFFNSWNDMGIPWYADHFNEFHAIFQVDFDIIGGTEAYWYFRDPRADISIAFADVSIKLFHPALGPLNIVAQPLGCQDLFYNGDAQSFSVDGWTPVDGSYLALDVVGPDSNGPSFKNLARNHPNMGAGQEINIACLEPGRTYKVVLKYFLKDGAGNPMACNPTASWQSPLFCPMFTIHVFQPWGLDKWDFHNDLNLPQVAGWNDFETTFIVEGGFEYPDQVYGYIRGAGSNVVVYLNEVNVTMISDVPTTSLIIPSHDPAFNCSAYCCEMVSNGVIESGDLKGWIPLPNGEGSIMYHDENSTSIKLESRSKLNSGPGQFIDTGCFVQDEFYEVQAMIKILDENGDSYACDKDAEWNDADFCPLFSIWYNTDVDLVKNTNLWFDVPNNVTDAWTPGEFNFYQGIFKMTDDIMQAVEASFMFRGTPIGAQIIVESVSLTPYMHEPTFVPSGYEVTPVNFFASSSSFEVNPYTTVTCDIPVVNGDFETGNTFGWFTNHGGELSIYRCEENGGDFCLKHSQRTTKYMGPKASLSHSCLESGRRFEVLAKIKLMDDNLNAVDCDPLAGINSHCPILTIHYTTLSGEEKWMYVGNINFSGWDMYNFNDFHGVFVVSEELALSTEAYFYFERPSPGTVIMLDNVEIKEVVSDADADYKFMSDSCVKFVLNGNAESGELRGWSTRFGGELIHHDEGADLTLHSIMHSGRQSFVMGPKHDLSVGCFTGGMRYNFEAKIKLIDDDSGEAYECDKHHLWIDDLACPLLTFQIEYADGTKKWLYFNNKTKGKWQADSWNFFQTNFDIDESITDAVSGVFYLERVRAGVSIIVDEVQIFRDCSVLIPNKNAELGITAPWYQHGSGEITIVNGGSDLSPYNAFASIGRVQDYAGPSHMLDVHCLTLGAVYEFSAQFKLIDAFGAPFLCDKNAFYGTENSCPYFTLVLHHNDDINVPTYLNFKNIDDSEWVADDYNHFEVEFEVTEEIHSASGAIMIFNGPNAGISMIFDDVILKIKIEGDCENLVPNGHFDNDDEMENWSIEDDGELLIISGDGANGSNSSLLTSGRLATNDGPMSQISHMCMYEGLVYEFTAYLKLLDEDLQPFQCNKTATYGTALACPTLGIEMHTPTGYVMMHPQNIINDEWVADEWNMYNTIFIVSNDLANAEYSHFKFKGAAPGVSILIDDMSTNLYQTSVVDCSQLIFNTDADNGVTSGWIAYGGGYIEAIDGGDNSTKAFAHYGRGSHHVGPKQNIEHLCLQEGQVYDLNARFKFEDHFGLPVGCDKEAEWLDPDYCLLFTFELQMDNGIQRKHFGNSFGGSWIPDEFNSFRGEVVIDQDMANADSVFFFVQGPSEDKVIIFDNISMKLRDTS